MKIYLCLEIKHYAMKTYGRMDIKISVFLTIEIFGVKWSVLTPCRFTLPEPVWTMKRRKLFPFLAIELRPLYHPSVTSCYTKCTPYKYTYVNIIKF